MSEPVTHTPGPWQWAFRGDTIYLLHPMRGHLTVMDFVRQGMNGAQPRFAVRKGDERENMGGLMVKGCEMKLADHPDARLIAAAPELLAMLKVALNAIIEAGDPFSGDDQTLVQTIRATIANAEGE